jgi:hypothetical protein
MRTIVATTCLFLGFVSIAAVYKSPLPDYSPSEVALQVEINKGKTVLFQGEPVILRIAIRNTSSRYIVAHAPNYRDLMQHPYIAWTCPTGKDVILYGLAEHTSRAYLDIGQSVEVFMDITAGTVITTETLLRFGNKLPDIPHENWGFVQPGEYTLQASYRKGDGSIKVSSNKVGFLIRPASKEAQDLLTKFWTPAIAALIVDTNGPEVPVVRNAEQVRPILEEVVKSENVDYLKPYAQYLLGYCRLAEASRFREEQDKIRGEFDRNIVGGKDLQKVEVQKELADWYMKHPEKLDGFRQPFARKIKDAAACFEWVEKNAPDFPLRERLRYVLYKGCYERLIHYDTETQAKARALMQKMLRENYDPKVQSELNKLIAENRRRFNL